jgi:hypothetical protein
MVASSLGPFLLDSMDSGSPVCPTAGLQGGFSFALLPLCGRDYVFAADGGQFLGSVGILHGREGHALSSFWDAMPKPPTGAKWQQTCSPICRPAG